MEEPAEAPPERMSRQDPALAAAADLRLPVRRRRELLVVRRARLTDDPDVLERILAGLLDV